MEVLVRQVIVGVAARAAEQHEARRTAQLGVAQRLIVPAENRSQGVSVNASWSTKKSAMAFEAWANVMSANAVLG